MWETFFRGQQPRQRAGKMPSPPSGAAPGEHNSTLAALAAAGTSCEALEATAKLPPTPPSCFVFCRLHLCFTHSSCQAGPSLPCLAQHAREH